MNLEIACHNTLTGNSLFSYSRYNRLQRYLRRRRKELILICSHPPTLTAGIQGRSESLLTAPEDLERLGIAHFNLRRGGDYTAHEPGQCVIYPHVDLKKREMQITEFVRGLLDVTVRTIHSVWGLTTETAEYAPGIFSAGGEKIASIGMMAHRRFTSHGLALNVDNDLELFRHILPCGYRDLKMTSIKKEGGNPDLLPDFIEEWSHVFRRELLK